jgi:hypothetical protein
MIESSRGSFFDAQFIFLLTPLSLRFPLVRQIKEFEHFNGFKQGLRARLVENGRREQGTWNSKRSNRRRAAKILDLLSNLNDTSNNHDILKHSSKRHYNFQHPGPRLSFCGGPRQTGKTTLLLATYPDALWIDLLKADVFRRTRFVDAPMANYRINE